MAESRLPLHEGSIHFSVRDASRMRSRRLRSIVLIGVSCSALRCYVRKLLVSFTFAVP